MPPVYLMPSFESTQNYQQEIANHSSQGLEVTGGDFFSHSWIIECLSKNHKARRDSERVSTGNPLPQSRCSPTATSLELSGRKSTNSQI